MTPSPHSGRPPYGGVVIYPIETEGSFDIQARQCFAHAKNHMRDVCEEASSSVVSWQFGFAETG